MISIGEILLLLNNDPSQPLNEQVANGFADFQKWYENNMKFVANDTVLKVIATDQYVRLSETQLFSKEMPHSGTLGISFEKDNDFTGEVLVYRNNSRILSVGGYASIYKGYFSFEKGDDITITVKATNQPGYARSIGILGMVSISDL